ncbi:MULTISPECIES: hypothetical protein [unclassified Sphingomonas]|uniref:hypothetical protein n=1 Tax=unclassified Sphingomonas TaxID=196159 RepID=UPI0006F40951|nr:MULTISPECIES: hypothetical protein [unclassified Sphingomonas]KQX26251.1 hypothetical protein ASD17_02020 [Sphingomonas sp. Root1294]KQY69320.1 hypothetical protein ASD39_03225 [Sphingomonas sp. Root50]KRB89579.1 hypothetical protein ASE22_18140 [Sphingomonas sp. Root720]
MFRWLVSGLAVVSAMGLAAPASAYLFWVQPNFTGGPVVGDEPGLGQAMPKATPAELKAHLLWNMRAGLNVAALQCQFSPILLTVPNYNDLLSKNSAELNEAYKTLGAYFKRTGGKTWQKTFDGYTTRTYNGFSTMHAQLGFCETASAIGREARKLGRGKLTQLAVDRMREFRNSLVPAGDMIHARRFIYVPIQPISMDKACWTKKDQFKAACAPVGTRQASAPSGRTG